MKRSSWCAVLFAITLLTGACLARPPERATPPAPAARPPLCGPRELSTPSVRRLTRREFRNAVTDLLGPPKEIPELAADEKVGAFDANPGSRVGELLFDQHRRAAEALAASFVVRGVGKKGETGLTRLLPCAPDQMDVDPRCAPQFVQRLGRRAYRRPLTADESHRLLAVYREGTQTGDGGWPGGVRATVELVLQAPQFLYRMEQGRPVTGRAGVVALDPYELASSLAFLLWNGLPDEALLQAAERGDLDQVEGIRREARRMLQDPRARRMLAGFTRQWLGLGELDDADKDPAIYPGYTRALGQAMLRETDEFVARVALDGDGRLSTLLTAPYSFVDPALARLYGLEDLPPDQKGPARITLPAHQRSGLLTQAAVLSAHAKSNQSSPVLRGLLVRSAFLCQDLPPPPPNVDNTPPPPSADATTRERFDDHRQDFGCAACHRLVDPIGFGFEHYDGVGAWRDRDAGRPIDSRGEVEDGADVSGTFDGAIELSRRLASSAAVRSCLVRQWFRVAFARHETPDDRCTLEPVERAFEASGGDLRALLVAMTVSEGFRFRRQGVTP